jgi:hypothetical protein
MRPRESLAVAPMGLYAPMSMGADVGAALPAATEELGF